MTRQSTLPNSQAGVARWLYFVAALVLCMVTVGGATRLTDSGLSITEWKPIMGAIPPLSEADWVAVFHKYQQIPEYKLQNAGMSLEAFKSIFWWEWAHRFFGRAIGLLFAIPLVYFALRRRLGQGLWLKLLGILALGAAQGGMGWFMVYSGLADRVDVSQYRLVAHLSLAALVFVCVIWVALSIGQQRASPSGNEDYFSIFLLVLIFLQIAAGGFVAGLDAGMGYNTWPKMDGAWIPQGLYVMQPAWRNWFENALTVQFNHRMLAYVVLIVAIIHAWRSFSMSSLLLLYALFAQVALGIVTLLLQVPIAIALAHQAMAFIVLAVAVWNVHRHLVMPSPVPDQQ